MNNFIKYPSIENHYNQKTIDYWRPHIAPTDIFYTQEKIHGANFSVHYNDGKLEYAKRSGFIGADESFYNHKEMVARYEPALIRFFNEFYDRFGELYSKLDMVIFGELCGGVFPGRNGSKAIQKGVYYSPAIEFVVFDVFVVVEDEEGVRMIRVLPINYENMLERNELPYCKMIFKGTFDECLAQNNTFDSNLYKTFLPMDELKEGENIAEGFVIKPLTRDIKDHLGARLLIKSKSPKWAEKVDEHETKAKKVESVVVSITHGNLKSYLTDNRYSNLISKHGPEIQDFKNFQQLTRELNMDVLEDYEKDHESELYHITKDEYKEAKTLFWKDVTNFVKSKILGLTGSNPAV